MKKLHLDGYLIVGVLYLMFALIFLIVIEGGATFESYQLLTFSSVAGLLPLIFIDKDSHQFAPSRLLALSFIIFILARPIIILFRDVELVEVGNGISDQNIFKTLLVISIFIWSSGIAFIFADKIIITPILNRGIKFNPMLRFPVVSILKKPLFLAFVVAGVAFILRSIDAAEMMSGVDYFTVVSDPEFHNHLFLFFLSKNFGLLWLLVARSTRAMKLYVGLLLAFSIGFLLIGLRGYFMAYLFIYLYFNYEKRKINLLVLTILAFAILYISSFILQYRLGFEIFADKVSMFTSPFYQQGATFEVVFGAVSFPEELGKCISVGEFILGQARFGDCVDKIRGVPFVEGGFASSIFAEAYYLGLIPFLIVSIFVGIATAILNRLSGMSVNSNDAFIAKLVIVATLPNLVYIGRSGTFDFIFKFISTLLIVKVFYAPRNLLQLSFARKH